MIIRLSDGEGTDEGSGRHQRLIARLAAKTRRPDTLRQSPASDGSWQLAAHKETAIIEDPPTTTNLPDRLIGVADLPISRFPCQGNPRITRIHANRIGEDSRYSRTDLPLRTQVWATSTRCLRWLALRPSRPLRIPPSSLALIHSFSDKPRPQRAWDRAFDKAWVSAGTNCMRSAATP